MFLYLFFRESEEEIHASEEFLRIAVSHDILALEILAIEDNIREDRVGRA